MRKSIAEDGRSRTTQRAANTRKNGDGLDVAIIGNARNGTPMGEAEQTDLLNLLHAAAENEAGRVFCKIF